MNVSKSIDVGFYLLLVAFIGMLPLGCGNRVASPCQLFGQAPQFLFEETALTAEAAQTDKQTFYVSSSSGDDNSNGRTPQTAWRTIAKVNSSKFQPGDQILFRRGDVWREQLNVPASGASGLPVTFGAYPNQGANAPVIAGSNVVTNWENLASGIYRARLEAEPVNVYINDQPVPLAKCGDLKDLQTTENSWFYHQPEKSLYVRLAATLGSSPAKHTIEAAVRDYNVYAKGKSHIKIDNLELKHAKLSAILAEQDGAEFWTISNCAIRNATEAAVYARPVDRPGAPLLRGWTIENNKIGRLDGSSGLDYDRAGILLRRVKDAVVKNNTIATSSKMGITIRDFFKAGGSEGGLVSNNKLTDNQGNISIWMTPNAVVTGNVIYKSKGYGIGIGVRSHNALITYNSINYLRQSDDETLYNGIDVNADSQNGQIYHNTIVNVRGFNLTLEQSGVPCNGWTVRNNIFDARNAPYYWHSNVAIDPDVTTYTFSNNIYVASRQRPTIVNHWHRKDMTLSEWLTATNDKFSFAADPQFVNVANNDLTLASNSPARDKAALLPDINNGKPLNIGAF